MTVDTNTPCPCGSPYPSGVCPRNHSLTAYLPGALAASQAVAMDTLAAENRALRAEVSHLLTKCEVSQVVADRWFAALERANDALEKQQSDLETARHERDEWHSLAVDSDREALRAEEEALAIRKSCNGKHWIEAPEDWIEAPEDSWEELGNA